VSPTLYQISYPAHQDMYAMQVFNQSSVPHELNSSECFRNKQTNKKNKQKTNKQTKKARVV
jgi:hypothetical protein